MTVYQCKFFLNGIDSSHKSNINQSFQTAITKHKVKKWYLLIPIDMSIKEKEWWDTWKKKQDIPVEYIDGSTLFSYLQEYGLDKINFGELENENDFIYYRIVKGKVDDLIFVESAEYLYYSLNSCPDIVLQIVAERKHVCTIEYEKNVKNLCNSIISGNGPVFIMANGGTGKSTLLASCAMELSIDRDVFYIDLSKTINHKRLMSVLDEALQENDLGAVLCVENPARNPDEFRHLYNDLTGKSKYKRLKVVFAERFNRLLTELLDSTESGYEKWKTNANAFIINYSNYEYDKNDTHQQTDQICFTIDQKRICKSFFLLDEQIHLITISEKLRSLICQRMIDVFSDGNKLNREWVQKAKCVLNYTNRSIADVFFDFRRIYNQIANTTNPVSKSIEMDWDTWKRKTACLLSDKVQIEDAFKYMAALDLMGVSVTLDFIQELCGLHDQLKIKELFPQGIVEPVMIRESRIFLRHDTVADNYFSEQTSITPTECLCSLIKNRHMDWKTVLPFERSVLSQEYVINPSLSPVDVKKLIAEFDCVDEYKTILANNGRLNSLERAKILISALNKHTYLSTEFKKCCREGVDKAFADIFRQEKKVNNGFQCWRNFLLFSIFFCDTVPESLLALIRVDDPQAYKQITKQVSELAFTRKTIPYRIYNQFAIKVYERIHEIIPEDTLIISYLIDCYLYLDQYDSAKRICDQILNLEHPNYKNLLSVLKAYEKYATILYKKDRFNPKIREINYQQICIFRMIEKSVPIDTDDYASVICRQARFTYSVKRDYDAAMSIILNIPDGEKYSYRKYIEMGIIYSQKHPANRNCYSKEKAEEAFLKSIELMEKNEIKNPKAWISSLRPLAQIYYWRWQHIKCLETCKKALKYKPNEEKIIELIKSAEKAIDDIQQGRKIIPSEYYGLDGQVCI